MRSAAERPCPCTSPRGPPSPPRTLLSAGVFVGYKKYDRRKQHIRELDERAEAYLAAQSGAESEGASRSAPPWAAGSQAASWTLMRAPRPADCPKIALVCVVALLPRCTTQGRVLQLLHAAAAACPSCTALRTGCCSLPWRSCPRQLPAPPWVA